jgi:hypothetical protein
MMVSCSADGKFIAQPFRNFAIVRERDHPERLIRLGPQWDVRRSNLSPDGRFVATGTHAIGGVKIWEREHGQLIKEIPGAHYPVFSPDGKRMAVAGSQDGNILTVGSWEGPNIPFGDSMAFSPDGNLLAVGARTGVIHLLDPVLGHNIADLEDPNQDPTSWLGFTPDGTRLVASSADGRAIHVWDLKRIRVELDKLGLDWEAPPYPQQVEPTPGALEVRVDGADVPAKMDEAIQWNRQARHLVMGPPGQRNSARALELMQKAVERFPDNELFLNTLGVAHYRNGQYAAAVGTLERSLASRKGETDAFDLFFLAMCHAKLGAPDKAKDCFDRAVKWAKGRTLPLQWVQELKEFRVEAETVLGAR